MVNLRRAKDEEAVFAGSQMRKESVSLQSYALDASDLTMTMTMTMTMRKLVHLLMVACVYTALAADPFVMQQCGSEVFTCSDGTNVIKDPMNGCAFMQCPDGTDSNARPTTAPPAATAPPTTAGATPTAPTTEAEVDTQGGDAANGGGDAEAATPSSSSENTTPNVPAKTSADSIDAPTDASPTTDDGQNDGKEDETTSRTDGTDDQGTENKTATVNPANKDEARHPFSELLADDTTKGQSATEHQDTTAEDHDDDDDDDDTKAQGGGGNTTLSDTDNAAVDADVIEHPPNTDDLEGWEAIPDVHAPNLADGVSSAFSAWQLPDVCHEFAFDILEGRQKQDESAGTVLYDLGVTIECQKGTNDPAVDVGDADADADGGADAAANAHNTQHFHIHLLEHKGQGLNPDSMLLHACARVEHASATNWLAMVGDSAVCETPSMRTSLELQAMEEGVKDSNGLVGDFLDKLDRQTAVVAGVAAMAFVLLILVLVISVRRQSYALRNRSILTGDVESADTDEDEREDAASVSSRSNILDRDSDDDDDAVDQNGEDSDGEEVTIRTKKGVEAGSGTCVKTADEEGAFMNSPAVTNV